MVDITDDIKEVKASYEDQMNVVFPNDKEELIDFLNRCKLKEFEVTLHSRCSAAFYKEATKELEKSNPTS